MLRHQCRPRAQAGPERPEIETVRDRGGLRQAAAPLPAAAPRRSPLTGYRRYPAVSSGCGMHEIGGDEAQRLMRIIRAGRRSVVTWRRARTGSCDERLRRIIDQATWPDAALTAEGSDG